MVEEIAFDESELSVRVGRVCALGREREREARSWLQVCL